SAAFGWVYGSVFGVEELVHPLWISPLADPDRMLVMSLYWGAGFILIGSALTAYNRISDGRYLDALLDGKGAAGIVFYTALFYGVQRRMLGHGVGSVPWMVAAGAFMVVFAYHWFRYAGGAGERMLVALTQVIHDAVGYFSNTLSFLRVAAFGLNHMALAIAVSALASMLRSDAGRWTILVFGNIFIVVLEGGIV
ncbi:MAG: ATPase, partial [Pseudomonadota bacterium]|nr:ATPase [Pseudomonadota bacterium]